MSFLSYLSNMLEIIFGISCVKHCLWDAQSCCLCSVCHFLGSIGVRMLSQKVDACVDHRQRGRWLETVLMRPEKLTFPSACSQTHIQRWYSYQHQSAEKGFSGWGCLSVNVRVLYLLYKCRWRTHCGDVSLSVCLCGTGRQAASVLVVSSSAHAWLLYNNCWGCSAGVSTYGTCTSVCVCVRSLKGTHWKTLHCGGKSHEANEVNGS